MPLEFSKEQMAAHLADDHDFVEWFVEVFAREQMPWTYDLIGAGSMKRMSLWGRRYAEHFGIHQPQSQAMFIAAMWDFGPDFFMFEPMASVARNEVLDDETKADTLFKLAEEHRYEFLEKSDARFWHPQYLKGNILGVPYEEDEEDAL
jgi:hypothetical protein